MAGSFATAPAVWAESSNTPTDNISAAPTASNRKLVVMLTADDSEVWTITQFDVGGVSPSTTFAAVDEPFQQARCFEWNEAAIASMSGVAITFTDGQFINPQAITHYWLRDVDQGASVQTSDSHTTGFTTVTISASSASGDVVAGLFVGSTTSVTVTDWDTLTLDQSLAQANYWMGVASSVTTSDSSHVFTHDSGAGLGIVIVSPAASGTAATNHLISMQGNS